MKLNRPAALIVALLTIAPWACMVFIFTRFTARFWSLQALAAPGSAMPPEQFFQEFNTIFRLQMFFMALMLALMAFYIVHVFRTDRVPADKKALWAVVLFLGNLFAMPFYWNFYIWPRGDKGAA